MFNITGAKQGKLSHIGAEQTNAAKVKRNVELHSETWGWHNNLMRDYPRLYLKAVV